MGGTLNMEDERNSRVLIYLEGMKGRRMECGCGKNRMEKDE